jgi:hypothetical protein
MNTNFMKSTVLLFLILSFLFCSNMSENTDDKVNKGKIIKQDLSPKEKNFKEFLKRFDTTELPLSFSPCKNDFSKFYTVKNEITRDLALKYLCGNDSSKLIQPTSGYYEYYYGYKKVVSKNLVLLIYFRPSYDCYSGYVLTTFNQTGDLIDEFFLSGKLNYEAQMESSLNKDLTIKNSEVIVEGGEAETEEFFANKITKELKINEKGKIILIKKEKLGKNKYLIDHDANSCFILKQ